MEARMADGEYSAELLEEYGRRQEAFSQAGGYDMDVRIQQTLEGLGLGKKAWDMPLNHLSGGQKTRALLARLLLEKPDLLMLDEPTNHLDIEAVEWLEHTLSEWQGAVLIVSHDRYFMDNVVNTIWEMSRAGIETYTGGYSSYLLQRQERWEYAQRVYEEEKDPPAERGGFHPAQLGARQLACPRPGQAAPPDARPGGGRELRRPGPAQRQKMVRIRPDTIRGTDRPMDVIDAIRAVNAIAPPANRPHRIKPRLGADLVSGTIVMRARDATIGFPGHVLFTVRDLELRRGECAALIGPNGSGKTTFLRTMLAQLEPLAGEVQLGSSLQVGYFAQAHDQLDPIPDGDRGTDPPQR